MCIAELHFFLIGGLNLEIISTSKILEQASYIYNGTWLF